MEVFLFLHTDRTFEGTSEHRVHVLYLDYAARIRLNLYNSLGNMLG